MQKDNREIGFKQQAKESKTALAGLREGARQWLQQAIAHEAAEHVTAPEKITGEAGHRQVARNGWSATPTMVSKLAIVTEKHWRKIYKHGSIMKVLERAVCKAGILKNHAQDWLGF